MSEKRDSFLAVYIDFENLALWAKSESRSFDVGELIDNLGKRGRIAIKQAYANWYYFDEYKYAMTLNAIDQVQVYSVGQGKNRADIQIVLDAMEAAFTHDHIDTFVIISGDSDFGPLANKLKMYGKMVVGIGPPGPRSHRLFMSACDEFIYLNKLVKLKKVDEKSKEKGRGRNAGKYKSPKLKRKEKKEMPAVRKREAKVRGRSASKPQPIPEPDIKPSIKLEIDKLPLDDPPEMHLLWQDILNAKMPATQAISNEAAENMAKKGNDSRKKRRYGEAAKNYLLANRILWESVSSEPNPDEKAELRWYMSSYASIKAGEFVKRKKFEKAREYYLAFFSLIQDDKIRERVDGLVKPMLTYYWGSAFREYGVRMPTGFRNKMLMPAEMGQRVLKHENQQVRHTWQQLTAALAKVNQPLLASVVAEMKTKGD